MHNSSKTVCVIIPAYDEENAIAKCVASIVQAKKDHHVEIIVADNGSTDRTREIAEAGGARVIVDSTRHVSGLRNLAATETNADILAFVDADCTVALDWIEKAAFYFDRDEIAAWGSPPSPPEPGTWVQRCWYLVRRKKDEVQPVSWLESMNLWVRRDVFFRTGGFNEALVTCEDVDFCYRAGRYGAIVADSKIRAIHYGEAATIRHFIKKEIWRGQNNWTALKSHGWRLQELKNILLPINFGLLVPLSLLVAFLLKGMVWFFVPFFLLLGPSILGLHQFRGKGGKWTDYLGLFLLLEIYFYCRTISTVSGLRHRLARQK